MAGPKRVRPEAPTAPATRFDCGDIPGEAASRSGIGARVVWWSRHSTTLHSAIVFALAELGLSRFTNAFWAGYNFDSLTMLYDSMRVAQGQIPYRDFFNFPMPGTFWLQGIVLATFGARAVNAVDLLIVTLGLLGAGLYGASVYLTGRRVLSLFAPTFVLFALAPHFPHPYHHWYAITAAVLTLLLMAWWYEGRRPLALPLAGGMCCVAVLFSQTEGAALALAIVIGLAFTALQGRETISTFVPATARLLLPVTAGFFLIALPVLVYFGVTGGLQNFLYDTLIWPNQSYRPENSVPFAFNVLNWIYWAFGQSDWTSVVPPTHDPVRIYTGLFTTLALVAIPLIVMLLTVGQVAHRLWWTFRDTPEEAASAVEPGSLDHTSDLVLLCGLTSSLLYVATLEAGNRDMMHICWASLLSYPALLGFCFPHHRAAETRLPEEQTGSRALSALFALLSVAAIAWYLTVTTWPVNIDVDAFVMQNEGALIRYIHQHSAPGDQIVALPYGGLAYFYGRPAAIGYTLLSQAGSYNTVAQFDEAARQIETRMPRLVIFGWGSDWTTYFQRGSPMLAWARAHYRRPVKIKTSSTVYEIYSRR